MECPYCGSVVTPGAQACTQCEVRIVWNGDEAEFQVPDSFVPVFVAYDAAMLPVVESLLAANGIPFVVPNDTTQDLVGLGRAGIGYNPIIGPPTVKVPSDRAQTARELIASVREPQSEEAEPNG